MGFESQLSSNCPIFSDADPYPVPPPDCSTGYEQPVGVQSMLDAPYMSPFPQELYIPRSEWDDRIEEMEREKSSAHDVALQAGVRIKDQDGYGYCWAFGTCSAVELARSYAGLPYVELSATSVAGPVKNYRNQGGWGKEALDYSVEHGWAPVSLWPEVPAGASSRYDTHECQLERAKNKVTEWWEIQPRDFDAMASALLHQFAAGAGYNHWGHLICNCKLVKKNGQYGVFFRNSWKASWGDNGCGVLLGGKAIPDGVTVIPRVTTVA